MPPPLRICFAASEVAPFAKTGGLADVGAALPRELHRLGHDVRVFLPRYGSIDPAREGILPVDFARDVEIVFGGRGQRFTLGTARLPRSELAVYFVDCPELYHRARLYTADPDESRRFAFFSRAVIESCQRMGWAPDVFHCNDWHTALVPLLLRTVYDWDAMFRPARTLLTIHNIGYQGIFGADAMHALGLESWGHLFDQEDLRAGRLGFLRTGLLYADALSTVSPTYAREIQTEAFGMGLEGLLRARRGTLVGILNGVDYEEWSPEHDRFLPQRYSRAEPAGKRRCKRHLLERLGLPPDPAPPLAGMISRLTAQKGVDLCAEVLPQVLPATDLRLAVLGRGESRYEAFFAGLARRFPQRVAYRQAHDEELAHLIEAGSDLFLMPSKYEPCGLNQMFSLRYGTIPVVRRTGGLADSVRPFDEASGSGTGIVFEHFDAAGLAWALGRALALYRQPATWRRLMDQAMAEDFSWGRQARQYVELYRWLLRDRARGARP